MTDTDYHNHPAVSVHQLMRILRAPALYRHDIDHPPQPTDAMRMGSLVHCAVLEPAAVADRYAAWTGPSRATKEGKATWLQFQEANAGREIVDAADLDKSSAIAAAVRSHPAAASIIASLDHVESPIFWVDPATATYCRSKPDGIRLCPSSPLIVDLKTTQDASPRAFARSAVNYLYHMQAAAYIRAATIAHGDHMASARFAIIAVETSAPHLVAVYDMSPALISAGVELLDRALRLYADCELTGNWPGYPETTQTLDAPAWYSIDV